jgi:hypothetical protein
VKRLWSRLRAQRAPAAASAEGAAVLTERAPALAAADRGLDYRASWNQLAAHDALGAICHGAEAYLAGDCREIQGGEWPR